MKKVHKNLRQDPRSRNSILRWAKHYSARSDFLRDINPKPIFIIGSYRSGTSILAWALGQHPNILPLEETQWIAHLGVYLDHLYELGTRNVEHSHIGSLGITEEEFAQDCGRFIHAFIVRHIENLVKQCLRTATTTPSHITKNFNLIRHFRDPKARWIDGTPENSHFVYGLSLLFPEARFIHIIRNPLDVAKSLVNFWTIGGAKYTEEDAFRTWIRLVKSSILAERALGSQKVHRIYYTDMLANDSSTLKKCLRFLGEEMHPDCLLPFREKINSSHYWPEKSEPEVREEIREKPYILEAHKLHTELLRDKGKRWKADIPCYEKMQGEFLEYAQSLRPSVVDRLGRWAHGLDEEIEVKNNRILELQDEVQQLSKWALQLDKDLREKASAIVMLERESSERAVWAKKSDQETVTARELVKQLQMENQERTDWAKNLDRELKEGRAYIDKLQGEYDERSEWAKKLNVENELLRKRIEELEGQVLERTEWATKLDGELKEKIAFLKKLQGEYDERTE